MSRPQRNRRLSRRVWSPENNLNHVRPLKRLFTPEIKRMLKDWLIRRRENPYPSRDEKKRLAMETGLTYTQICNWFANWRRKLKNTEHEKAKNSWGTLIKNYNTNARGNVEQFSISSEDSIWEENVGDDEYDEDEFKESREMYKMNDFRKCKNGYEQYYALPHYDNRTNPADRMVKMDHRNYYSNDNNDDMTAQCFQVTSTTTDALHEQLRKSSQTSDYEVGRASLHKTKYKQKMMEKYLRDTQDQQTKNVVLSVETTSEVSGAAELSKWLESAAKFTPNKNNYFVEWNKRSKSSKERNQRTLVNGIMGQTSQETIQNFDSIHHKDELDAAEALANLAFNCRQRITAMMQTPPINAISS